MVQEIIRGPRPREYPGDEGLGRGRVRPGHGRGLIVAAPATRPGPCIPTPVTSVSARRTSGVVQAVLVMLLVVAR